MPTARLPSRPLFPDASMHPLRFSSDICEYAEPDQVLEQSQVWLLHLRGSEQMLELEHALVVKS